MTRMLNRNATSGYRDIVTMVREDDIKHDPWGTAMHWLSALADMVYGVDGEILDGYKPSDMFSLGVYREENATVGDLYDMYEDGHVTTDDMCAAYKILYRFTDWCELAGRSY